MNKGKKCGKSFKICDVTQLGPNLKNVTNCFYLVIFHKKNLRLLSMATKMYISLMLHPIWFLHTLYFYVYIGIYYIS